MSNISAIQLTAHTPEDFLSAYSGAGQALQQSPECLSFELTQCDEDAKCFVLRIEWTSADDHMMKFRKGPNFPPFFKAIGPFVKEITEMRHYHHTPVRWSRAN